MTKEIIAKIGHFDALYWMRGKHDSVRCSVSIGIGLSRVVLDENLLDFRIWNVMQVM